MGEQKKINFSPIGNYIITTCYLEKESGTIDQIRSAPKIKQVQQVLAVGPRAEINVGDWILVDHSRFIKHVKVKSQIRAGVGGEDMIKEEFVPPFIAVPGSDIPLLKISDREIEGVIDDYNILPENIKAYTTMEEYEKRQEEIQRETEEAKKAFVASQGQKEGKKSKGPLIVDSTKKLKKVK